MKKYILIVAVMFALVSCSKDVDKKAINSFLTDLSEVYTANFNGPDPDDVTKIDFAVKRLYLDSPNEFTPTGKGSFVEVDKQKVHDVAAQYFKTSIHEDQNTADVDFTSGDKYQFMPTNVEELVFSKVDEVMKSVGDTLLLKVNVYSVKSGWKGDINSSVSDWQLEDPNNIPSEYKVMRTVIYRCNDSYRILSYADFDSK